MKRSHRMHSVISLASLTLLAACAGRDPNEPALSADLTAVSTPGQEVTLAVGQSAEVRAANVRVTFNRVVGDSRCPTRDLIQCVWAGSVIVELDASPLVGERPSQRGTLETVAGRDTTTLSGQFIQLLRVTPDREHSADIPASRYHIVIAVGARK